MALCSFCIIINLNDIQKMKNSFITGIFAIIAAIIAAIVGAYFSNYFTKHKYETKIKKEYIEKADVEMLIRNSNDEIKEKNTELEQKLVEQNLQFTSQLNKVDSLTNSVDYILNEYKKATGNTINLSNNGYQEQIKKIKNFEFIFKKCEQVNDIINCVVSVTNHVESPRDLDVYVNSRIVTNSNQEISPKWVKLGRYSSNAFNNIYKNRVRNNLINEVPINLEFQFSNVSRETEKIIAFEINTSFGKILFKNLSVLN